MFKKKGVVNDLKRFKFTNEPGLITQLVFYGVVFASIDIILWSFYSILLYRETASLQVVILDRLLYFLGIWCGMVVGSFLVDRYGYRDTFRISFFASGVFTLLLFLLLDKIELYYPVFAVLIGASRGIYWASYHCITLKEIRLPGRTFVINISQSIKLVLAIVLPILAGSLIFFRGDYQLTLFLGFFLYFFAAFMPMKYSPTPESRLTFSELVRVTRKKDFEKYFVVTFLVTIYNTIIVVLFAIVPFMIIGDEFGVGALTSFVGIVAALISALEYNVALAKRIRLGFLSYIVLGTSNLVVGVLWSIPTLFVRATSATFAAAISDTVEQDIDYSTRELILGNFKNESAVEMNLLVETIYVFSRVSTLVVIYVLLTMVNDSVDLIKVLLISLAFVRVPLFFLQVKLKANLRK